MVGTGNPQGRFQIVDISQKPLGQIWMAFNRFPIFPAQFTLLMKDFVGNGQLTDVMEKGTPADVLKLPGSVIPISSDKRRHGDVTRWL
jgi:hypothetical protein